MKPIKERMSPRELIVYAGKLMFEKDLTDAAGGNISIRVGDDIFMSPTLAGAIYHWNFDTENVLVGTMKKLDEMKKHPLFSREGLSHLSIYEAFPYVGSVVHAHPKYINAFVVGSTPLPPMTRTTMRFGTLEYHEEAEPYSQDQANKIVKVLRNQEDRMKSKAAAVLMPKHGIIVAGLDIMTAVNSLQRINNNAFAVLGQKLLD